MKTDTFFYKINRNNMLVGTRLSAITARLRFKSYIVTNNMLSSAIISLLANDNSVLLAEAEHK